jgi:hypothetical protein
MSYGHIKLLGRFVSVALVALRVKVAIMRIRNDLLSSMKLGLEETPSGPSGWWQKRLRRWWWTKREGHGTATLIAGAQLMPRHSLSPVTCHISFTLFFSFTELLLAPHSNNRILSSDSLLRDMDFPPFHTICETQARPSCTSHEASASCHQPQTSFFEAHTISPVNLLEIVPWFVFLSPPSHCSQLPCVPCTQEWVQI